ncbi:hypothetical protein VB735_15175 [Halotia wernerae UHCC 0503]|nr:hypothetical protein [Halotia wernerae UHCC 0503]
MTNAEPNDITARLESIDQRLEDLGDELDEIRTIQSGMRREFRFTSQSAARLERTVNQLADIVRIQQQEATRDRQLFEARITQIWEYLLRQGGNGSSGGT